ncbi:class I SAM-dependent methyltransferase [Pseudoalteromonas fenneropenaei]|uniref:Class I SAM-dependent methyltransferase n=1 Tax=Pseudoalteromonas fenneropenaei TaxID=1737459 RepID=A0ABV7CJ62_9GAMM
MLQRFIAKQLANPSGWFGRFVTAKWLEDNNVLMNQMTLDTLAIEENTQVLEIGFGSGHLLSLLLAKKCSVTGIELSSEMLKLATKRFKSKLNVGQCALQLGDIQALPFSAQQFDAVCSVNTLYFWSDPDKALQECHRVLRAQGKLVLTFDAKSSLAAWSGSKYGFRLYECDEVEALLSRNGFANITWQAATNPASGLFYVVSATAL